jgi:hypothetical protein
MCSDYVAQEGAVGIVLCCLVAVTLLFTAGRNAEAQVLGGSVTNSQTEVPIGGVSVLVLDAADSVVDIVVTDSTGSYVFRLQNTGSYQLQARAWGYDPFATSVVDVAGAETVNIRLTPARELTPANRLRGVVVDDSTRRPVANASILLLDKDGVMMGGTISDVDGMYEMQFLYPGQYTLRIDAELYRTVVTPEFQLEGQHYTTVVVRLSHNRAIELEGITVTGEAPLTRPLRLQEYDRRRERGVGYFITREQLDEKKPARFSEAMYLLPSVRVVRMPIRDGLPMTFAFSYYTVRIKGVGGLRENCPPVLYIDGNKMGPIDDVEEGGPDAFLHPEDLEGIEVYRPGTVPPEYAGSDAMCGVVAVWYRPG